MFGWPSSWRWRCGTETSLADAASMLEAGLPAPRGAGHRCRRQDEPERDGARTCEGHCLTGGVGQLQFNSHHPRFAARPGSEPPRRQNAKRIWKWPGSGDHPRTTCIAGASSGLVGPVKGF
jgi:hypothetical protein